MSLSTRQLKRLNWLRENMALDLHNDLLKAYLSGQDSCSSCGVLFDVRDENDENECLDCWFLAKKIPLKTGFSFK